MMRFEAEAKNSSEKERMREVRGADMRSIHVVPKVLSIWSDGMESVGADWMS